MKPVSKGRLNLGTPTFGRFNSVINPKVYRGYAPIFKEHLNPSKSKADQLLSEMSETEFDIDKGFASERNTHLNLVEINEESSASSKPSDQASPRNFALSHNDSSMMNKR